jgi:hypothetical protein
MAERIPDPILARIRQILAPPRCHPVRAAAQRDAAQTRDLVRIERPFPRVPGVMFCGRSRVCAAAFHAAARTG